MIIIIYCSHPSYKLPSEMSMHYALILWNYGSLCIAEITHRGISPVCFSLIFMLTCMLNNRECLWFFFFFCINAIPCMGIYRKNSWLKKAKLFDYFIDIYAWQSSGLGALAQQVKRPTPASDPKGNISIQAQSIENAGQNRPLNDTGCITRYTNTFHQAELIQVYISALYVE